MSCLNLAPAADARTVSVWLHDLLELAAIGSELRDLEHRCGVSPDSADLWRRWHTVALRAIERLHAWIESERERAETIH